MATAKLKIIIKIITDISVLVLVLIPILLLHIAGTPFKRGFFANDISIAYPYKSDTIPLAALFAVGIIIAIVMIAIVEYFNPREANYSFQRCLYRYGMVYIFGVLATHLIVDICRYSTGKLRPHYLDICKPNITMACQHPCYFHSEEKCSNSDKNALADARMSFISCHTTFSTFTVFFIIFYLQFRFCFPKYRMLKHGIQSLLLLVPVYVSITRITDYQHHRIDVLAGWIVGFTFAAFCVFWVVNIRAMNIPCKFSDEARMRYLRRHIGHYHEDEDDYMFRNRNKSKTPSSRSPRVTH